MAKSGIQGIKELKKLTKAFEEAQEIEGALTEYFEECAKALAARLLERVILRTPVEENDNYEMKLPNGNYVTKIIRGGTLRRGWTGEKEMSAKQWANSLPVKQEGSVYKITVSNPVEYAPYVEYGHRQKPGRYVPQLARYTGNGSGLRLKKSWVPGQYMLEISAKEVKSLAPALLQKMLKEFLKSHFKV